MHDGPALLAAECDPWPSLAGLVDLLRAAGLQVQAGAHAVRVSDCEHFVFRDFGGAAPSPGISADAQTVSRLLADAQRVSGALAAAGVHHRFEVYGPDDQLRGYFHHGWSGGGMQAEVERGKA